MAVYYLDTSALVKTYRKEPGTERLDALMADPDHEFHISSLSVVEVHSSALRLVREGAMTRPDVESLVENLNEDVAQGVVRLHPLRDRWASAAAAVLLDLGARVPLRSLDALHLAITLDLRAEAPDLVLVTSDHRLAEAARVKGVPVLDPAAA